MERERKGEKYQCAVASHMYPIGNLACNPAMCPDWESNQRPLDLQASSPPLRHASQGEADTLKKERFIGHSHGC